MATQPIPSGAPALGHLGEPGVVYQVENSVGDSYQTLAVPTTQQNDGGDKWFELTYPSSCQFDKQKNWLIISNIMTSNYEIGKKYIIMLKDTNFTLALKCKVRSKDKVIFEYKGEHLTDFPEKNSLMIKNYVSFWNSIFGFKNTKKNNQSTKRSTKRSNKRSNKRTTKRSIKRLNKRSNRPRKM